MIRKNEYKECHDLGTEERFQRRHAAKLVHPVLFGMSHTAKLQETTKLNANSCERYRGRQLAINVSSHYQRQPQRRYQRLLPRNSWGVCQMLCFAASSLLRPSVSSELCPRQRQLLRDSTYAGSFRRHHTQPRGPKSLSRPFHQENNNGGTRLHSNVFYLKKVALGQFEKVW